MDAVAQRLTKLLEIQDRKILSAQSDAECDEIYTSTHRMIGHFFTSCLEASATVKQLREAVNKVTAETDIILPIPPLPAIRTDTATAAEVAREPPAVAESSADFRWWFLRVDTDIWSVMEAIGFEAQP